AKGRIHVALTFARRHKSVPVRWHVVGTIAGLPAAWRPAGGLGQAATAQGDGRRRIAGVAGRRDTAGDTSRCSRCEGHIQSGRLPRRQRGVGAYSTCAVTRAGSADVRNGYIGIAAVGQRDAEGATSTFIHTPETQASGRRSKLRGNGGSRTGKSNGRGRVTSIAGHRDTAGNVSRRSRRKGHVQRGSLTRRQCGVGGDSACAIATASGCHSGNRHVGIPAVL